MEAALAEAMAADDQAEAAGGGGGEPAPFTPEHQAAVEAAMAEALAAIDAVANAGDVRDNAAQRREAWAAIARMGALADAEGLTEGAAAAVAGAAPRRPGGNVELQAAEARVLEAAAAERAPEWVQRTERAMQLMQTHSERCRLRAAAAAEAALAAPMPRPLLAAERDAWLREVRRVTQAALTAWTTWGNADAPTDDAPFMEASAIVEQLWMAARQARALRLQLDAGGEAWASLREELAQLATAASAAATAITDEHPEARPTDERMAVLTVGRRRRTGRPPALAAARAPRPRRAAGHRRQRRLRGGGGGRSARRRARSLAARLGA